MTQPTQIVAQAYLVGILLIGMVVSPLSQFAIALALIAIQLYIIYRPPKPSLKSNLLTATIILTPLTLISLTGNLLSALMIIPAIPLLDTSLRQNAANTLPAQHKPGRSATLTLKALTAAILTVLAVSVVLVNLTLFFTSALLMIYLAAVVGYSMRRIPKTPYNETKTWNRIIAGNTATNPIHISTTARLPLSTSLSTDSHWVHIQPSTFTLIPKSTSEVKLTYAPPLAGPTKLQLRAATLDPWGLIATSQTLQPLDLHVIPKAKYAQWLARKYLQQTASGSASAATAPPPRALKAAKRSVEYFGSRLYQPGDRLKDVDWKHTFMVNEVVVKEYAGSHGQPSIILADLTANSPQSADRLAYNLVMSALTLATESLPSGLALYSQDEVVAAAAPTNPRETLKKTLNLTSRITIATQPLKVLQPTEMRRLQRTISQLNQTATPQAQRLSEILEFEQKASQTAAKTHPATRALAQCIQHTPAPAVITVASPTTSDASVSVTLERLRTNGYSTVELKA